MYRSQDEPLVYIPAFTGRAHDNCETLISGLTSAVAERHAIAQQHTPAAAQVASASASTGVSPGKYLLTSEAINYLQQMRDLHSVFETGALTEAEFLDQKKPILENERDSVHCSTCMI